MQSIRNKKLTKDQAELEMQLNQLLEVIPQVKAAEAKRISATQKIDDLTKEEERIHKVPKYYNNNDLTTRLAEIRYQREALRTEKSSISISASPTEINKRIVESLVKLQKTGQKLPPAFNSENLNLIFDMYPTSVNKWLDIPGVLPQLVKSPNWNDNYKTLLTNIIENHKINTSDPTAIAKFETMGKVEAFLQNRSEISNTRAAYEKIQDYMKRKAADINDNDQISPIDRAKRWAKNFGEKNVDKKHLNILSNKFDKTNLVVTLLENYHQVLGKIAAIEKLPPKKVLEEKRDNMLEVADTDRQSPISLDYDNFDASFVALSNKIETIEKLPLLVNEKNELETKINAAINAAIEEIDRELSNKQSDIHGHHFFRSKLIGADSTPVKLLKEFKASLKDLQNSLPLNAQREVEQGERTLMRQSR